MGRARGGKAVGEKKKLYLGFTYRTFPCEFPNYISFHSDRQKYAYTKAGNRIFTHIKLSVKTV